MAGEAFNSLCISLKIVELKRKRINIKYLKSGVGQVIKNYKILC